jgi:hypothetical protein
MSETSDSSYENTRHDIAADRHLHYYNRLDTPLYFSAKHMQGPPANLWDPLQEINLGPCYLINCSKFQMLLFLIFSPHAFYAHLQIYFVIHDLLKSC